MLSKKGALHTVTKCWTKQGRPQREKKLHPVFTRGAAVIIQSGGLWNLTDKQLLSVGPTDWRTGRPKRVRTQAELCEGSGQVLSGTGQLLFYQLHPHPPPPRPTAHAHRPHARGRFNMTARPLIDRKLQQRSSSISHDFTRASLAYLMQASCVFVSTAS